MKEYQGGIHGWAYAAVLVAIVLYVILFVGGDREKVELYPLPTPERLDAIEQGQKENLDEMIRMQEELNQLYRELIELEELRLKMKNGKAWSA